MARRKSDPEVPVESPIAFRPCSNGEFEPRPETPRDRRAEARFQEIAARASRRLSMSRREFARSAGGFVAALAVLNETYGCGGGSAGGDAGDDGGVVGRDAAGYDAPPDAIEDAGMACELLEHDVFVFDVQTHAPNPLMPWRDEPLTMDAETFIRTIFVDSDTTVACLSGIPGARDGGTATSEARALVDAIIDRIGGPRLRYHVNVDPTRGPGELDYMAESASMFEIAAWKAYPHVGPWRLDDPAVGFPFLERARELGVPIVAAHRGIASDPGGWTDPSSPADVGAAAAAFPDVQFLTYHSGWQSGVDEAHPFDPTDPAPSGVDRLVKAVLDAGIGPDGNVYAELGSTWRNLMTVPAQAAHVLGKLLLHLGEDRILWGTDSVFTGSPQEQLVAFRAFQIPVALQDAHGYPALTDEARAKILGLNAARVYGVDVDEMRCVIADDFVDRLAMARADDPDSVWVPSEKRWGPRTRREYLAFLRWEDHVERGG